MKKRAVILLIFCLAIQMCGCEPVEKMSDTEKYDEVIYGLRFHFPRYELIESLVENEALLRIDKDEVDRNTDYHNSDEANFNTDRLMILLLYLVHPLLDKEEPINRDKFALAYNQVLEIDEDTLEFNTLFCSGLNPRRLDTEKTCEMAKVFEEHREFYPEKNPKDIEPLADNLMLYRRVLSNLMIQQTLYLCVGEDELMKERQSVCEKIEDMLLNEA